MSNAPQGTRGAAGGSTDSSLPDPSDTAAAVNAWVGVVRRARLGSTATLVALTVASYADSDGSKVFPGQARIAYQCELSLAAVKRALRKLRDAGLVELVRRGNRRSGMADEYRLILAEDILERVEVPNPDQERQAIEVLKGVERGASRDRYERRSRVRCDPRTQSDRDSTGHPVPVNPVSRVTSDRLSRVTGDPPPSIDTLPNTYPPEIPLSRAHPQGARRFESNGKPWADLQQRYDASQLDDFHVIEEIEQRIGGFDTMEERTAEGMLSSGAHVKAIANKILADRRQDASTAGNPDGQVDFADWQYGEYDPETGVYEAGPAQCDCGKRLRTDTDHSTSRCSICRYGDHHG